MQTGVNPLTLIMRSLWRRSDPDDDAGSDCPDQLGKRKARSSSRFLTLPV